jgi:ferredoxin
MKVRVDSDLCAGHGRCYELAPEVYGEDERGHCRVLRGALPPELADKARLGERNCPEGAIFIDDD